MKGGALLLLLLLLGAIGLGAIGLAGCGKQESSRSGELCPCPPEAPPAVDATLLAFLSKARAAHHEADLAEAGGDLKRAAAALDALVSGARPGGPVPRAEVAEVVADARARLAELRSAAGQFDAAEADVADGLRLAPTKTHFRGHLIEVRGVVEQRRSAALKEQGDAAGAERAKEAAIRAFQESMEVNDEVIVKALGDAGAR